ncbi:low molecular weight phosphotyrosine protein phosphatase-like [Clytia hemisphaerica]|uniref:Phosphotyrosine protein phosphatase I domain-containing protein n=1 Tax=Clytia hemisphaerica TaxID=252671 RepID=A0A7M5U9Z0_9CNID
MAADKSSKSVLFVCLGNICRSPMAEGIFKHLVKDRSDTSDWLIESCGTARYHVGEQPDDRTLSTLEKHGIKNFRSTVRQLAKDDFSRFQWIFVFDDENKRNVDHKKPASSDSNINMIRRYDTEKDGWSYPTSYRPLLS